MQKGLKMAIRILGGYKRVAKICGVSQWTVSGWINIARCKPKHEHRVKILNALNNIYGIQFYQEELMINGD